MQLVPVVGANDDIEDPRVQWLTYMRTRWYSELAAPSLIEGTGAGITEPDFVGRWRDFVPVQLSSSFHPPWWNRPTPPSLSVPCLPVTSWNKPTLLPAAARDLSWMKPLPLNAVPIIDVAHSFAPQTQINPLIWTAPNGSADFHSQLEQYTRLTSTATLQRAGIEPSDRQQLPMVAPVVVGHLKKGANIVLDAGKWVVKAGLKVLGPVGKLGAIYDLWNLWQWLNTVPSPEAQAAKTKMPKILYDESIGKLRITMKDGTVYWTEVAQI